MNENEVCSRYKINNVLCALLLAISVATQMAKWAHQPDWIIATG